MSAVEGDGGGYGWGVGESSGKDRKIKSSKNKRQEGNTYHPSPDEIRCRLVEIRKRRQRRQLLSESVTRR